MISDIRTLLSGLPTDILLDVGSNTGQTIEALHAVFPFAQIHGFEPGQKTFEELKSKFLKNSKVVLNSVAVGEASKIASFYESNVSDMSSLLTPSAGHTGLLARTTEVKVITLDEYAAQNQLRDIALLKTDTQGGDLKVLRGANHLLQEGCISLVATEVLFHNVYDSSAELDEIYRHMRNARYRLVGFYAPQFRGNCVGCMDALFIHERLYDSSRDRWQRRDKH